MIPTGLQPVNVSTFVTLWWCGLEYGKIMAIRLSQRRRWKLICYNCFFGVLYDHDTTMYMNVSGKNVEFEEKHIMEKNGFEVLGGEEGN